METLDISGIKVHRVNLGRDCPLKILHAQKNLIETTRIEVHLPVTTGIPQFRHLAWRHSISGTTCWSTGQSFPRARLSTVSSPSPSPKTSSPPSPPTPCLASHPFNTSISPTINWPKWKVWRSPHSVCSLYHSTSPPTSSVSSPTPSSHLCYISTPPAMLS